MQPYAGFCWSVLAALVVSAASPAVEPVAPGQFDRLHRLIRPQPAEQKWEQVPWLTDLWEARRQAAEQGKPILLWEMDGHPLGCT
jgi:hypothetical protein